MDLLGWAKRKALRHEAAQVDTPEKAGALLRPYVEALDMSPRYRALLLAVLSALLAGVAHDLMMAKDALSPQALQAATMVGLTAGLVVLAAKLRTWSGSHVESVIAGILAGGSMASATALQSGGTFKAAAAAFVVGALSGVALLLSPSPAEQAAPKDNVRQFLGPGALLVLCALVMPPAVLADEAPVRMTFGALGSFTVSDAGAATTPGAFIRVEGPLVLGKSAPLRLYALADIMGLPGATAGPDLTDLATFTAARGSAGLLRDVGALVAGGQDIRTALVLHGAFATRIGTDPAPLDRYARSYGVGLQFEERVSGAYVRLELGHDDAVAQELGHGHLLVSASVPVPHSAGVASLGADAALSLGHPEGVVPHDRVTFSLRVTPPRPAPPPPPPAPAVVAPVSAPAPPPAPPETPEPSTPTDPWAPDLAPGPLNVHR